MLQNAQGDEVALSHVLDGTLGHLIEFTEDWLPHCEWTYFIDWDKRQMSVTSLRSGIKTKVVGFEELGEKLIREWEELAKSLGEEEEEQDDETEENDAGGEEEQKEE